MKSKIVASEEEGRVASVQVRKEAGNEKFTVRSSWNRPKRRKKEKKGVW